MLELIRIANLEVANVKGQPLLEMNKSAFNTEFQQDDLQSKVIVGLERISEAFKSLLWDHAKALGLSPIQIQILIFITYHKAELCNVSYLAQEFNVTKATVSDAVRVLVNKELIQKDFSGPDARSYSIHLTDKGEEVVNSSENFALPIRKALGQQQNEEIKVVYESLARLIHDLNVAGILNVQRNCFSCRFYEKKATGDYCHFLSQDLMSDDIRLDCPEFETMS